MATASIIIRQNDGNQIPQSRDDLILNVPVTLLNQSNAGVTSWLWQLVDKPFGSTASLSSSIIASPTFVPDIEGTYLIKLIVNNGVSSDQKGAAVKTVNLHYRIPAASEEGEFDPVRGWAEAVNDALQKLDDGYAAIQSIDVPSSRVVVAGYGLIGGGDLSADRTFSLATFGTSGTYNSVVIDAYGRTSSGSNINYAFDNTVVHITGNENISGQKTFVDPLIVNDNIGMLQGKAIRFETILTNNWSIGKNLNLFTRSLFDTDNLSASLDVVIANSGNQGFAIGTDGGTSVFEVNSDGYAYLKSSFLTDGYIDRFSSGSLNVGSNNATGGTIGKGGTTGTFNWGINGAVLYSQSGTNSVTVDNSFINIVGSTILNGAVGILQNIDTFGPSSFVIGANNAIDVRLARSGIDTHVYGNLLVDGYIDSPSSISIAPLSATNVSIARPGIVVDIYGTVVTFQGPTVNFVGAHTNIGGQLQVDGYIIDPSDAANGQAFVYNGSAFVPTDVTVSLQKAYDTSNGADPSILLTGANGSFNLKDDGTFSGAQLFDVLASNSSRIFGVSDQAITLNTTVVASLANGGNVTFDGSSAPLVSITDSGIAPIGTLFKVAGSGSTPLYFSVDPYQVTVGGIIDTTSNPISIGPVQASGVSIGRPGGTVDVYGTTITVGAGGSQTSIVQSGTNQFVANSTAAFMQSYGEGAVGLTAIFQDSNGNQPYISLDGGRFGIGVNTNGVGQAAQSGAFANGTSATFQVASIDANTPTVAFTGGPGQSIAHIFDVNSYGNIEGNLFYVSADGHVNIGAPVSGGSGVSNPAQTKLELGIGLKIANSSSDVNDGVIGNANFTAGLNIVGINSDSTSRKLSLWGSIIQAENNLGNTFIGTTEFTNTVTIDTTLVLGGYTINPSGANSGDALVYNGTAFIPQAAATPYTVSFMQAYASTNGMSHVANGDHIQFDNTPFGNIAPIVLDTSTSYTTTIGAASIGRFTLTGGKTYRLIANAGVILTSGTNAQVIYQWYDATNNQALGLAGIGFSPAAGVYAPCSDATAYFGPGSDTLVEVRIVINSGATGFGDAGTVFPWANIETI